MKKAIPFVLLLCVIGFGCDVSNDEASDGEQHPRVTQEYRNNTKPEVEVEALPISGHKKLSDRTFEIKAPGKKYDGYVLEVESGLQKATFKLDMDGKKYKAVLDLKNHISMIAIDGKLVSIKKPNGKTLVFGQYKKRNQKALNAQSSNGKARTTKRYRSEVEKPIKIIFSFLDYLHEKGEIDNNALMFSPAPKRDRNRKNETGGNRDTGDRSNTGNGENRRGANYTLPGEAKSSVVKAGIGVSAAYNFLPDIGNFWKSSIVRFSANGACDIEERPFSNEPITPIVSVQSSDLGEDGEDGETGGVWYRGQGLGMTKSAACYEARNDVNQKCTNQYCIGCDIILSCDAQCLPIIDDYGCAAGVSGKSCGSEIPPDNPPFGYGSNGGLGDDGSDDDDDDDDDVGCVEVTYQDNSSRTCCGTLDDILECVEDGIPD